MVMAERAFMFNVSMLAQMTGGNKQYLSRKIKQLVEDPQIQMKAELNSNKEGYQISEKEVLRCFDKISPRQIEEFKEKYWGKEASSKIRRMDEPKEERSAQYLEEENRVLMEWRFRMASTPLEKKKSPEIQEYLRREIARIQALKEAKLREYVQLEQFLSNCDTAIADIRKRLEL